MEFEIHGPDGGLEDAELRAAESAGGRDVGEEGLINLGAEEAGQAVEWERVS